MKFFSLILGFIVVFGSVVWAQKQNEVIKEEKPFSVQNGKKVLYVDNLFGSVEITGYDGDRLIIEVDKTITAKNDDDLAKGMKDIQLAIVDLDDGYYVYIETGYTSFDIEKRKVRYDNCGRDWDDYDFNCDFKVRIPENVILYASTVNHGDVEIENITGDHRVRNVNGSIAIKDVSGNTSAHTVNGDIDVIYRTIPTGDCSYETINGDINVYVPRKISAEIEIETFNGEFYTSFEDIRSLGNRVVREEESENGSTKYKLSSSPVFQIGDGDLKLSFNSFNGDMYLKQIKN